MKRTGMEKKPRMNLITSCKESSDLWWIGWWI